MMASAVTMSPTAVAAAEVQANGDISAASRAPGKVQGMEAEVGAWDGVPGEGKKRRVSSDVSVRFPVTSVEKQPERMVVIGDVHGDLGERKAASTVLCTSAVLYLYTNTCTVP